MSRDVCGICMCPYDDDGCCGCKSFSLAWTLLQENKTLKQQNQELLEVLKVMVENFGPTPSEKVIGLGEARSIIAKATGETVCEQK